MEKHALPTATPEEVGLSSGAVVRFIDALERAEICMHGFLIARRGKILAEGYWKPFHREEKHRLYSCSKSFVSLAVGYMADEGKIRLDDKIVDYFPDKLPPFGPHPYIAQTTIRDMLMMASPFTNNGYTSKGDDWIRPFFVTPPDHLPGVQFNYDTSATHTMGALVERVTGLSFFDYLRPRLLDPVGFSSDAYCIKDPRGITWGGSGVVCTVRDFAKVALCCLQGGQFEGRQVLPEWYVREATSRRIDNYFASGAPDMRQGYGYQFWRFRHNAFAFYGMGGQFAICVPDKDLLVVMTGDDQWAQNSHIPQLSALWEHIYGQLSDAALPEDVGGLATLKKRLENLSIVTVPGAAHSPHAVDGATYAMDENAMGFLEASFSFTERGGVFRYKKAGGSYSIAFGYGEHIRQTLPEHSYDCITSGAWGDENTLNLCCYAAFEYCGTLRITASFREDTVTLRVGKVAERFLDGYAGIASGKRVAL